MKVNQMYLQILICVAGLVISKDASTQGNTPEIKDRILKNAGLIGISREQAENCIINSSYKDAVSGIEYIYIQQTYKSIKVFNTIISLAFKNSNLVQSSGNFLNTSGSFTGIDIPRIEADLAVSNAARHLKLRPLQRVVTKRNNFRTDKKIIFDGDGIAKKDIETELLWVQDDSGKVHLAWNVSIDILNSNDWWNVRIDALTGEVVNKDNWTVHETFLTTDEDHNNGREAPVQLPINNKARTELKPSSVKSAADATNAFVPPAISDASYLVVPFPQESTNYGAVSTDNNPWLKAGPVNNATTYGWHFDGNTSYSVTRGNNVHAYEDSSNTNSPGRTVTSSTQPPCVNFSESPDFLKHPLDSIKRNFGIVNLFYWNNILHDLSYQYGFNENAGNFQADNLSRGGAGNDYVIAEAQDGAGTDNANFNAPPDGFSGRMQMYLFSGPPEVLVTGPTVLSGRYTATESQLSRNNKLIRTGPVTGQLVLYQDPATAGNTHEACDSSTMPVNSVAGKIALISRGTCPFTTKMRAAQNAGAIGVVLINNIPGPPIGFGGTDNDITIPGIMLSQDDGNKIINEFPQDVSLNMATGIFRDGDIDNGIIAHEYGHGISNRLTGGRTNASCLSNAEHAGEGWSDYIGLMLTTKWQNAQLTDGTTLRPIGTYVNGTASNGTGIRRIPYTTDMLIDTLTYKSMDGNSTGNGEVHNIGEIFCSALWDMTWNIIQHEGSISPDLYNSSATGGNVISFKLMMEGLKLQPCRPGFLDSRNAILAADSILYNNKHKCDIWNAFARRGMGFSAVQGLSTRTDDQIPAFDVPSGISINKSVAPSVVNAGTEITYTTTVSCQCQVSPASFTVSDTIPAGFTYISSSNGTLENNTVQFAPVNFSEPLQDITLTLTLKATGSGCTIIKPVNDDRETNSGGELTPAMIGGSTSWVTSANRSYNGSNAWFAANPGSSGNFTLTSGTFVPGNLSILTFWHYFVTENYLDGGKVEISPDNGSTWLNATPYFLLNGYKDRLNNNAPQPNTSAFTGTSYATGSSNNGQFIQSIIDLSSFSSQPIKIRFRFQTNNSNAFNQTYEGWYIDDITVTNGCGGVNRIVLETEGNTIDAVSSPFFIVAGNVLPLVLSNFTAAKTGNEVSLNWETTSQINTMNFEIERSADGMSWIQIGTLPATGSSINNYTYNDKSPLEHMNYYRIKINDRDGLYTYTVIKKIEFDDLNKFTIVPNPAINTTTVYFGFKARGVVLFLSDLEGRILQKHPISDNTSSYNLHAGNLPTGTYLISLQSKTGSASRKLFVNH